MATIIQELFHILSITHNHSTAYHPQTDGQLEHANQKLEQYIQIFTDYYQKNWRQLLPLAQYTLNSWPNATTKKAPFELIMGHIPRMHQPTCTTSSPTLNDRLTSIFQARKDAADTLRKSQSLELPSNFVPYCVGDRVWLEGQNLNTTHPSAKLAPRHYGPFLMTAAVSRTSHLLKLPASWRIHNVFHTSLLTPYKETTLNGNRYQEPVPDLIDGQPKWEVEQILGARKQCNQLQYLVRWKGFSEAHDSWEPLAHINADQLIKEFYHANPQAICSTIYKTPPISPHSVTIRCIQMSTHPPTISSPFISTSSLPLSECIDDVPLPIPLSERIEPLSPIPLPLGENIVPDSPEQEEHFDTPLPPSGTVSPLRDRSPTPPISPAISDDTISVRMDHMEGIPPPHGYKYYDKTNPSHVQYGFDIPLEDRTHKPPYFICFQFDTNNQLHHYPSHTIVATRQGITGLDYGEPLVAKLPPYHPLPPPLVDDHDLITLAAVNADSQAVDIAMIALDDTGLSADVDRLRRLVESRTDLQRQAQTLERKQCDLRSCYAEVTACLISTRACSRLHPYLQGTAVIHNPCNQAQCVASSGTPLADILNDVIPVPPSWFESPCLHDDSRATDISQWVRFAKHGTVQRHPTPPPPQ
jgi:hypothetical protein